MTEDDGDDEEEAVLFQVNDNDDQLCSRIVATEIGRMNLFYRTLPFRKVLVFDVACPQSASMIVFRWFLMFTQCFISIKFFVVLVFEPTAEELLRIVSCLSFTAKPGCHTFQ